MASREESNRKKAENIKKIAIDKINSMSDKQINDRVVGMGDARFSVEATVKMVLSDFALFIKHVEHFKESEYEDVKQTAVDAVLPIFGKKILETKSKDMSKLSIAEKRRILIDNINNQTFDLCHDNAERDKIPFQEGIIDVSTVPDFHQYLMHHHEETNDSCKKIKTAAGDLYLDPVNDPHKRDTLDYIPPIVSDETIKKINEVRSKESSVEIKNDFKFIGSKTCLIRFEKSIKMPKKRYGERVVVPFTSNGKDNQRCWIFSTRNLCPKEIDALSICSFKTNIRYHLNRVVLQDIINGKINKKADSALTIVKERR